MMEKQMVADLDKLVRVPQALEMLGISRSSLFRLEKSGALAPRVRIGRRSIAYRLSSLVAFMDACAPVVCGDGAKTADAACAGPKRGA